MKVTPFLAFLDFLAPAIGPSEGLEIPPYLQSERREPPTAGPDGDDLTKRPESASAAMARALALLAEGT